MFGYVLPLAAEMKVREWNTYRAYYCGLCKELAREYGFAARMLLNYDLVFAALLADGAAQRPPHICPERCVAGPLRKRPVCQTTEGLALAADALVLTAYYKFADDCADEHGVRRLAAHMGRGFLARAHRKARERRPELDRLLAEQMAAQGAAEQRQTRSADEAADATARMTQAIFAASVPGSRAAARLGLFVGRILYYLDAAEDYEKDTARGSYNVFALQGLSREEAVGEAQRLCRLSAGEAALAYNLIQPGPAKPLLDNIIFLGLPHSIALAGQKRRRDPARET